MDVMTISFPGDATAGTFKRRLDKDYFPFYVERYLWRDGNAPLAGKPKFYATQGPVPDAGCAVEREIERSEFEEYIERYWSESTFGYFGGTPAILDIVCCLGRDRSYKSSEHLALFKSMASFVVRTEKDSLLRFGEIRPVSIQLFHVFDEQDGTRMNFHVHNLLFLT